MSEETSKTYVFGQDGNGVLSMIMPLLQSRGVDPSVVSALTANRNGLFGGDNGLLALIILFAIFGGGFGNWGNGFGNNGGSAVATDMIMQTLNRNGVDIASLANSLNVSTASVTNGINSLATQLCNIGGNLGMSTQQVVNAIQAGNTNLAAQLAQCCCDNKLLATQQGYENRINNTEQTAILGGKIDNGNANVIDAINKQTTFLSDKFCDLEKREMQNKIDILRDERTILQNNISNANQTAAIQQYVGSVVSPLATKINEIECKLPGSVTIPYSPVVGIPSCVAAQYGLNALGVGPYYNNGSIWS